MRSLGEGGLGEVWLAERADTGERVALKLLSSRFARHPGATELLRREFEKQRRLDHPHVLGVEAFLEADDAIALVMARASDDARSLVGAAPARLLPLLLQVARALEHAHSRGVIHRDLKPANVLLDADGRALLADFGQAAAIGEAGLDVSGGGTPAHASPQQLEGAAPAVADDLYGFGALAYELFSGHPPLGEAPDAATVRVRRPPSLGEHSAHPLPDGVVALVDRLLEKSPGRRPADFGEVIATLAPLAGDSHDTGRGPPGESEAEDDDAAEIAVQPVRARRRGAAVGATSASGTVRRRPSGGGTAASDEARPAGDPRKLAWAGFAVLMLLALATFLWLPQLGREDPVPDAPGVAEETGDDAPAPEPIEPPETDRETRAELRQEAEEILGRLVERQNRLSRTDPERWAGDDWAQATALSDEGDDLLIRRDYRAARDRYREALSLVEDIDGRRDEVYAREIERGREALATGDADTARDAYTLALSVRPDDSAAERGLERAGTLDEVLERMVAGERREEGGDLERAREHYRQALSLDGDWRPAREAVARVERQLADRGFSAILSRGYSAMAAERYGDAIEAFEAALAERPGSSDASDGLAQAREGRRLQRIRLAQARAAAFEQQERWAEAATQYREALAIDDTLSFARAGRERAETRASLDAKLQNLIDAPAQLLEDPILREARGLLDEAREVAANTSGPRLDGQVARLDELIELASAPQPVELRSDGRTRIRVSRVGDVGTLERETLELRPGDYVAIGSRDGYRDVRVTFSVRPGRPTPAVEVICTQPI